MNKPLTIGDATFYLGDCLEVMMDLPENSVDTIITDPPYLINYKTGHRKDKTHDFCSTIMGDDDPELISESIRQCHRILENNSALYMFCSQDKVDFFKREIEKFFDIKNMIIWVKNNWTAGDLKCQFGKQYEIIFLANKGKKEINGKRLSDVWDFRKVLGKWQYHQNEKPVHLIEQCIYTHTKEGDIICDPFMGSGTTAIACHRTGRKFIGIEKEEKYFDIAIARYRAETKQLRLCDIEQ